MFSAWNKFFRPNSAGQPRGAPRASNAFMPRWPKMYRTRRQASSAVPPSDLPIQAERETGRQRRPRRLRSFLRRSGGRRTAAGKSVSSSHSPPPRSMPSSHSPPPGRAPYLRSTIAPAAMAQRPGAPPSANSARRSEQRVRHDTGRIASMPPVPQPGRLLLQETLPGQLGIALNALRACPSLLLGEHDQDIRDRIGRCIALIRDDCQDLLRNHNFYTSIQGPDLDAHDKSMISLREKMEGHRNYFRSSNTLIDFPWGALLGLVKLAQHCAHELELVRCPTSSNTHGQLNCTCSMPAWTRELLKALAQAEPQNSAFSPWQSQSDLGQHVSPTERRVGQAHTRPASTKRGYESPSATSRASSSAPSLIADNSAAQSRASSRGARTPSPARSLAGVGKPRRGDGELHKLVKATMWG